MIGDQCWLKENLDVGTRIDGSVNQTDNSIIEKYCQNNLDANCTIYGGLYQWNETMQYVTTAGTQGICPSGWHLPTLAEYQTLKSSVGGDGNALKEIGQGTGTNTSGFSALLGGRRSIHGTFDGLGNNVHLWSSTQYNASYASYLYMYFNDSTIHLFTNDKEFGYSVRCLKD